MYRLGRTSPSFMCSSFKRRTLPSLQWGRGKAMVDVKMDCIKCFVLENTSLSAFHVGTGFDCYQVDREWLESHPFIYHEDTDDEEEQKAPAPATVVPVPVYQGIFPHILYFLFYLHTLPVPFPQAMFLHFTLHICTLILV